MAETTRPGVAAPEAPKALRAAAWWFMAGSLVTAMLGAAIVAVVVTESDTTTTAPLVQTPAPPPAITGTVLPPGPESEETEEFALVSAPCDAGRLGDVEATGRLTNKRGDRHEFRIRVDLVDDEQVKVGEANTTLNLGPGETGRYSAITVARFPFTKCVAFVDN